MYTKNSESEILELLETPENLTFQSQLDLQEELSARKMRADSHALEQAIEKRKSDINALVYLKDIGFKAEQSGTAITISRTTKAFFGDIIAMVCALVFIVIGIVGIVSLIGIFLGEYDFVLGTVVKDLVKIGLGFLGIKFLSGFKRFFDYLGFELSKSNGIITLKKRFDLKLEEVKMDSKAVRLEESADALVLLLDKEELLFANPKNVRQKMTINALAAILKHNYA